MAKKILITGATGLIGSRLIKNLLDTDATIKILSTNPQKAAAFYKNNNSVQIFFRNEYDTPTKLKEIIEDSDTVFNLAGANVNDKRWSEEFKKEIYNSRIKTTKLIVDSIKLCGKRPECLINASGAGVYGFRGNGIINEESILGNDFLANVCKDWETEAMKAIQYNVRVVVIRMGIVLDENGGALKEFLAPFKFHFGAYQGSGKQWLSWIHIEDIINLYIFVMERNDLTGAINGTSPYPVTNKEFVKTLGEILNVKIILPVPEIILKIVIGDFAKNLTTGQRIYPERIINKGFKFKFPELKNALRNLLISKLKQ